MNFDKKNKFLTSIRKIGFKKQFEKKLILPANMYGIELKKYRKRVNFNSWTCNF